MATSPIPSRAAFSSFNPNHPLSAKKPQRSPEPYSVPFFALQIDSPAARRCHDVFHREFENINQIPKLSEQPSAPREEQLRKIQRAVVIFCQQVRREAAGRDLSSPEKVDAFVFRSLFNGSNICLLLQQKTEEHATSVAEALVMYRKTHLDVYDEKESPAEEAQRSAMQLEYLREAQNQGRDVQETLENLLKPPFFIDKTPPEAGRNWTFLLTHPQCAQSIRDLLSVLEGTGFANQHNLDKMKANPADLVQYRSDLFHGLSLLKNRGFLNQPNIDALFANPKFATHKAIEICGLGLGGFVTRLQDQELSFVIPFLTQENISDISKLQPDVTDQLIGAIRELHQKMGRLELPEGESIEGAFQAVLKQFLKEPAISPRKENASEPSAAPQKQDRARTVTEADLDRQEPKRAKRTVFTSW